jgi:tetratricopeptide (TPR) repeat protein
MYRLLAELALAALIALPVRASSLDDFDQGMDAHNRHDDDAAIAAFNRALAAGDLDASLRPAALFDRGVAYFRKKKYAYAIADFSAVLALTPGRYDATSERMKAYRRNAQSGLAAEDCDALLKMRPKSAELSDLCGVIRWENGRSELLSCR